MNENKKSAEDEPIEISEAQHRKIREEIRNELVNEEYYQFALIANKRDLIAIASMQDSTIHNARVIYMFIIELMLLLTISLAIWIK